MAHNNTPGIALEPNIAPLADGTNPLQPGCQPGIILTNDGQGNPGIYLGRRQINFIYDGVFHTGIFHVIQAIKGTWLSAATRQLGWGAVYGPEDGYGAYVEGIVRREDGSYIWDTAADKIRPGELFAIEIYKGKSERKIRPKKYPSLPDDQRESLQVKDPLIGIAEGAGLAVEIIAQIFGVVGLIKGFVDIPFQMAYLGRDPHLFMAVARAQCYARTSFVWRKNEGVPLAVSKVFHPLRDNPVQVDPNLFKKIEKHWRDSWIKHIRDLRMRFKSVYTKIYMEVSRKRGDVTAVGEIQLRKYLKKINEDKYGTASQYCDKLMKDVASANWLANSFPPTAKPMWEMHRRRTKYPD